MAIQTEQELRRQAVDEAARRMMTAARTAPKTKGRDTITIIWVTGQHLEELAVEMEKIAVETEAYFFARDAQNIRKCEGLLLLGTRIEVTNLPACGYCGFETCEGKNIHHKAPCAFNTIDLGIAIGSLVSMAADSRVDSRVMFSVGTAAMRLNLLDEKVKAVCGIPLSISSKSPFFDRK